MVGIGESQLFSKASTPQSPPLTQTQCPEKLNSPRGGLPVLSLGSAGFRFPKATSFDFLVPPNVQPVHTGVELNHKLL